MDSVWRIPFHGDVDTNSGAQEICVIGVFGKSSWGHTSKSCVINLLSKTYEFPPHEPCDGLDGDGEGEKQQKYAPKIEAYYDERNRILYLHLVSIYDAAALSAVCSQIQSKLDSHASSHDLMKNYEVSHILSLVFLFSVCHILMVVHPVSTFDISYDRLFQRVSNLRSKLVPLMKDVLKECNVGRDWWVNARPSPPRLLLIFQRCHLTCTLNPKQDLSEPVGGVTKKRKPPVKRLQHTIEDQVYRILRSSRVLTNNAVNCLFSVPPNQAFVHIMTDEFKTIEKEEDPILGMIDLLRDSFIRHRDPNAKSKAHQLLTTPPLHWMEDYMDEEEERKEETKDAGSSLRAFLFQHASLVLDKKGFNDSIGRNPLPSHFELPTLKNWIKVANGLYHLLLTDGPSLGTDFEGESLNKKVEGGRSVEDMFEKVVNYRQYLRSKIDIEMKYSEARCSKVLPIAIAVYQNSLPSHYTSKVHNNQLNQALRTYNHHARGPATEKYRSKLQEECTAFWSSGRQLCEVRSLTDRHCVHRFHILASQNGTQDPDANPPVLFHSSRSRSTATSSCGTVQGLRDDPFDLKEANYEFYVQLDKKATMQPVDVYAFPVYQPGDEARNTQASYYADVSSSFPSQILSGDNQYYHTSSTGAHRNSASVTTQEDDQGNKAKNRSRHASEGLLESGAEDNAASTQGSVENTEKANEQASSQELSQNNPCETALSTSPRKLPERASPTKEHRVSEGDGGKTGKELQGTSSIHLNFALSFGGQSEGSGQAQSPTDNVSQREEIIMENIDQQLGYQKNENVEVHSEEEKRYIDGMIHSNCPKGVLPLYPSWSLVKLGSYSHYAPARGLETPGFLPGTSFLVPWDIPVDKAKDDSAQWPVPGEIQPSKKITIQPSKSVTGRKNRDDRATVRAYIGYEYETLRGQRFICSGPDKPVKVTSSGIVKDSCHKLLENDMPLYTPSPASGRGGKVLLGQLMRVYVVIPPEASLEISLNPQVAPGPSPSIPTFSTGVPELTLSNDSAWVLRLPYVYVSDLGLHHIPKEPEILQTCKVLKGMIKLLKK